MKKVIHWLDENFELYICMVLLAVFSTILFVQVISRYVFNNSLSWSEELARYLFIWLAYIGISYGAKQMKHLRIDVFLNIFPQKIRPYVLVLSEILVAIFALVVVAAAYITVGKYMKTGMKSPANNVPLWFVHASAFIGYILTFIRQLQAVKVRINDLNNPKAAEEEEVIQ